jgi:predicted amidohydrolase
MVLPGYALMAQGTQVHVAAWPGSSTSRHLFLSRAFASQAAAYVIDVGAVLRRDQIPDTYREFAGKDHPGESCIIAPNGEILAGPVEEETTLIADCSSEQILLAKTACDVGGHYSRPDIFQLHVNRQPHRRVVETQSPAQVEPDPQPADGVLILG